MKTASSLKQNGLPVCTESRRPVCPVIFLRQIALVIILTRAGLSLNIADLKQVGRPAVFMCFLPACAEMIGTIMVAPLLLGVSFLDAAVIGSVMAAVSPAVVVPRMIKLLEEGYGVQKSIPQLILAAALF